MIKAILDFFTALIFASGLGFPVCLLAIPQFAVQTALYLGAAQIVPLTTTLTPDDDGGFLGLLRPDHACHRPADLRHQAVFPVADMTRCCW